MLNNNKTLYGILAKPDTTLRDRFFIVKRLTLAHMAELDFLQQDIKKNQKIEAMYQIMSPKARLLNRKKTKLLSELLGHQKGLVRILIDQISIARNLLFELMTDKNFCSTWREVAECLSISHVAMQRFLESMDGIEGADELFSKPSLLAAAINYAEKFGDRECLSGDRPARVPVLHRAAAMGMIKAMHENPTFDYQCQAKLHKLFPEFPKPEPKREFRVV